MAAINQAKADEDGRHFSSTTASPTDAKQSAEQRADV
jgi:hypothetical protein